MEKKLHFIFVFFMFTGISALAQFAGHDKKKDTTNPVYSAAKQGPQTNLLFVAPNLSFDESPYNHNIHITSDGNFYYTINGGNSANGMINKFDLAGNFVQTFPIQIDGRGLSYNFPDGNFYASLYGGDIVRINSLAAGTFTTIYTGIMQDAQASFSMSPDGTKFYNFFGGTLYVHDFATGAILDTITGLQFGAGNYGGNACVAVDTNFIYTWNSTIKTVYIYDQSGNQVNTMVLDSGDNGHSLSIANGKLFVSKDANYAIGTWYGYDLYPPAGLAPVANFSCTDTTFCEKQCIDYTDMSTNNPTSWQWFFPGADSTSSTQQNPLGICYNAYGGFDVTLIACNAIGCDTISFTNFIHEFQSPVASITLSNDTLYSITSASYQWYSIDSGIIAGAISQYYVPTSAGSYYVIITDSNGCNGASNVFGITTSIHSHQSNQIPFSFYPNPFSDHITMMLPDLNTNSGAIIITDVYGRSVFQNDELRPQMLLDLSSLQNGIYFLQLTLNDDRTIQRILKQ